MRRLAWFAGGFSGGVFLAQYLLAESWLLPCAFLAWGLGAAALALPWDIRRRAVVVLAALAVGLGYHWLYARQVQRPAEALAAEEERICTVTLLEDPEESDFGAQATARLAGVPGKAVYYGGRELLELEAGQTLTGPVRLRSAARIREEDVSAYTSRGVFLLAYGGDGVSVGQGTVSPLRRQARRAGRALEESLDRLFDGDAAGLLTAVLTGERAALSEPASIALSEAGLSHILAVSGTHCAILLGLVSFFVGKHRRRALFFCAAPLLIFYVLLTGCRPSAVRACVMLTLLLAGPLFRRESDGPTSLLAALMLILLENPFAAASVSLQLSFAAVAGILWLTPRLYALAPEAWTDRAVIRGACLSLSASAGALAFTAPLSAWYFGTLSLLTPLSGLLCLPAAAGAFCFGMLAALAGLFCLPLGRLLALPADLLARYILAAAGLAAKIPHHAVYFANPYLKYWLIYVYVLFAAALLLRRAGKRKYLLAAGLSALTLALAVRLGAARYQADLDVVVLDVGQGQSVILASGGEFALVDCGSANSWKDAGETAAHQLLSMGCKQLDRLILTHWDSDHVSGVSGLLARLEAKTLLVPEGEGASPAAVSSAEAQGAEVRRVTERETIPFGRGTLTVFPPLGEAGSNQRGLTILVSVGDKDFLITGDMDAATERKLLAAYALPDVEGMMAGHHGSKYATSQELLEAAAPETVCVSVGGNAYGHPAQEVLDRLARQGCAVCRTDAAGTIHLSWNQED